MVREKLSEVSDSSRHQRLEQTESLNYSLNSLKSD